MEDNYSWLDSAFEQGCEAKDQLRGAESASDFRYGDELLNQAKQTIISQIEIEKLRARIEILEELGELRHEMEYIEFSEVKELLADLTEKLK